VASPWAKPIAALLAVGYTTRVLVRRPAKPRRFSGNVVVEMLDPSNLFDLNIGWALSRRQFIRNGDAWVGITAKPIAVAALKAFDPGPLREPLLRESSAANRPAQLHEHPDRRRPGGRCVRAAPRMA
jgi:alpha/beta hydrolase family protein